MVSIAGKQNNNLKQFNRGIDALLIQEYSKPHSGTVDPFPFHVNKGRSFREEHRSSLSLDHRMWLKIRIQPPQLGNSAEMNLQAMRFPVYPAIRYSCQHIYIYIGTIAH
jgi:hypothetical protein